MQGFVQFNGYFGCGWCVHPGSYVLSNRGGSVKYILLDEVPPRRTEIETLAYMQQSLTNRKAVYGVKNPSCLINLNNFNIIIGFLLDYMHCICLGIAEQFVDLWLSSNSAYSLSAQHIREINSIVTDVKVPNQVQRLSRSIQEKKYWKSREWENSILYYSLPILLYFSHMKKYAEHWALLVTALHILLKKDITRQEIIYTDNLLKKFVVQTQFIYSQAAMTYNIHQMLHLAESVADWGPLWNHSGMVLKLVMVQSYAKFKLLKM